MPYVGTLAWALETGGRITVRDRLQLARLAVHTVVTDLPCYALYRAKLWRGFPAQVDLADLCVPNTDATKAASDALAAIAPAFIVHHSIRTYWFSRLIGIAEDLSYDDEMLYLASLAHDIGLLPGLTSAVPDAPCFSIRGAHWAQEIASKAGWNDARARRLAEAIILNLNGRVPMSRGVEANLMMRGVLVDVTALNAWRVNPRNLQEVFTNNSLLDQPRRLPALFAGEANRHPQCRAHFATDWLGFGHLMKICPWR